jgi:hypothetical protein
VKPKRNESKKRVKQKQRTRKTKAKQKQNESETHLLGHGPPQRGRGVEISFLLQTSCAQAVAEKSGNSFIFRSPLHRAHVLTLCEKSANFASNQQISAPIGEIVNQ